jgi:adhesin transport system outer membrane protein
MRYTALMLSLVTTWNINSADLATSLENLVNTHPRVSAAKLEKVAASLKISETRRRQWGPQVDLRISKGDQRYKKPLLNFTEKNMDGNSVKLTQLLYDFGKSSSMIRDAKYTAKQSDIAAQSVEQGLLLEALTAYLSKQRAEEVLKYAMESEKNIKEATKLEGILVKQGKGYSSNVLQAKTHLAGAQSRRVQAEGGLKIAIARVKAVFRDYFEELEYANKLNVPQDLLPMSVEEAKSTASMDNKQIKVGLMRSSALEERVKSTHLKEFRPKIQLALGANRNFDKDGNRGLQEDTSAMVEAFLPINAAGAGRYAVDVAKSQLQASQHRELETKDLVMEQVAIAWQNLLTAKTNSLYLQNQVNIAKQFLELARKERKLGRRTLLDVLSAETSLINAQSDHASTNYDISIASFTLLQAMGKLEMDVIRNSVID